MKQESRREFEYLKKRYSSIISSVGVILIIASILLVIPLVMVTAAPSEARHPLAFIVPAGFLCGLGVALRGVTRGASKPTLSIQEGGVIVLISWLIVVFFSSLPFVFSLKIPFSHAFFEAMSGWTTTGLSVIDVTTAGPMILLWRSVIQFAGGAGLAIIMMSAIAGPVGVGISSAEGRSEQLAPHVRESARLVLIIYSGNAIAGIIAYKLAGLSLFDAVNHAFAAVSTGGFSTRPESIGHWQSLAVEAVTLPLMLLGSLSFVTAWLMWRGKVRYVIRNGEVQLFAAVFPIATASLFLFSSHSFYPQLGKSCRVAIFETVSALTTTGFATVSYEHWNGFGVFLLIVLMLIGGGACSTAGGIKQYRIYILWKTLWFEFRRLLSPRNAVRQCPVWEGDRRVFIDDAKVRRIAVFIFLYTIVYTAGVGLMCACGFTARDSLFEFASAVGTVGLSMGVTSPSMPALVLWAETLAMFLGRLEFMVVFVSLAKLIKDGRKMAKR